MVEMRQYNLVCSLYHDISHETAFGDKPTLVSANCALMQAKPGYGIACSLVSSPCFDSGHQWQATDMMIIHSSHQSIDSIRPAPPGLYANAAARVSHCAVWCLLDLPSLHDNQGGAPVARMPKETV